MISTARSARPYLLALGLAALALPAGATAGDGGATTPGAPPVSGGAATKAGPAHAGGDNGLEITTRSAAMVHERLSVSGTASSRRTVVIQRRDARHGWSEVARATPAADHTFRASWRPVRPGRAQLR